MDRYQDALQYETRQASLYGRSDASEPVMGLNSPRLRGAVDPWALHLGSRPSSRHCQPLRDAYTLVC